MKGLLTVIQVTRPEPTDTNPRTAEIAQWTEMDQIGRGENLSALSNTLFDVYYSDSYTAKSLWDELDRKYNPSTYSTGFGSCVEIIIETKSFLKNKFEMKDMGEADVILGIKLFRSTNGIAISQSHYVEKIIEKFGYHNSRIPKTSYDSSVALFKNKSGVAVAQLRYTSCPDRTHLGALDRVLRYLKGTVSLVIRYGRFSAVLEGYSDASWIAKNSGSNGCSGYVITLCGGAVSWKSTKQTLIARSTFKTELCTLDTTSTEAGCLFGLLLQLPIVSQPLPPILIHCNSQITIAKVESRKYNQKIKRHIQVRLKSIRALVSDRIISIDFVGTKDNVADPLMKGLICYSL
ncbi:UNVERIFIED_CONTAM: Retrovirus-related Pol polyprotein from transposon TNT 1-94 [Sesamum latifolium]|uniref:Retrovirus-related Pol polyprotein from transposon TNT 1-94 n=1 Tax=Sesamum latifolium TaxID=2727402 RepID=A0AAW2TPI5_9LAMI